MQKQFTANVPAPDKMCLEGNLSQNWKRFKRQFGNHCIASRLSREKDENYQVGIFLAVFGPDACEIYDNLKFEAADDKNDLKKVIFLILILILMVMSTWAMSWHKCRGKNRFCHLELQTSTCHRSHRHLAQKRQEKRLLGNFHLLLCLIGWLCSDFRTVV